MDDIIEFSVYSGANCSKCGKCCELCGEKRGTSYFAELGKEVYFSFSKDTMFTVKPYVKKEEVEKLRHKYDYDEEKGFLGEDGCKLPRKKRPIACLLWVCEDEEKRLRQWVDNLEVEVERMMNKLREFRLRNEWI